MRIVQKVLHVAQRRLLWLLLCSYAVASLFPGPGLWVRGVSAGALPWVNGGHVDISMPLLLLAFLLASAGFAARVEQLGGLTRYLGLLGLGLAASTMTPVLVALVVFLLAGARHDEALEGILTGLAFIGSMPIAGSSTAWSQNAGGNPVLSLGLVLVSTLASPLVTPLGLSLVGHLTRGDYAEHLHELASQGSSGFLVVAVVAPSLLGVLAQRMLGPEARARVSPALKLCTLMDLLVLNYSNASSALPQAFSRPDQGFLLVTVLIVTSLCVLSVGLGALIGRCMRADARDRLALMFGLGMSNNGAGLVLASSALPEHPEVLLPIISYNLVQQIVAGIVDAYSRRVTPGEAGHRGAKPRNGRSA